MDNYEIFGERYWLYPSVARYGTGAVAIWYLDFLLFVEAFSSLTVRSFYLASKIYVMFISLVVPLFEELIWRKSGGDG